MKKKHRRKGDGRDSLYCRGSVYRRPVQCYEMPPGQEGYDNDGGWVVTEPVGHLDINSISNVRPRRIVALEKRFPPPGEVDASRVTPAELEAVMGAFRELKQMDGDKDMCLVSTHPAMRGENGARVFIVHLRGDDMPEVAGAIWFVRTKKKGELTIRVFYHWNENHYDYQYTTNAEEA